MPVHRVPFGIRSDDLTRELNRRERQHRHRLASRLVRLARLRAAREELAEYHWLLAHAAAGLEAEQQELMRRLAAETRDPSQALTLLRQCTEEYRQRHRDLLEGVMALIAPYLTQPRSLSQHPKGGLVWPSDRPDERTGSGIT